MSQLSSQIEPGDSAVRERIEAVARAIREKNVDALMTNYAHDVVVYDVYPPLDVRGADEYRRNFERWFSKVRGNIDYEMRGLHVTTAGRHAFCHCLTHVTATTQAGSLMDYWVRVTNELELRDGEWRITHEHVSMPAKR